MAEIHDFGEKIGGARKDFFARGINLGTYDEMNPIEKGDLCQKKYIWKTPDYAKMAEKGEDIELLFMRKLLRDSLPSDIPARGPNWTWRVPFDVDARRRGYVNAVNVLRDAAMGASTKDEFHTNTKKAYDSLNHEEKLAMDTHFRRPRVGVRDAITPGQSYWAKRMFERAKLDGWPTETKEVTRKERVKQPERELAKNPMRRGLPDYRQGISATPEMFQETFGFRGVEFGNWVNQQERQANLNMAFDALCDLSDVLGVPKKEISLNGTLALALGSRGHGGGHAAHYEPSRRVFNLTKPSGAGCLSHEWFHGLDHFIGSGTSDAKVVYGSEGIAKGNQAADGIYEALLLMKKRVQTTEEAKAAVEGHFQNRVNRLIGYSGRILDKDYLKSEDWTNLKDRATNKDASAVSEISAKLLAEDNDLSRTARKQHEDYVNFNASSAIGHIKALAEGDYTPTTTPTDYYKTSEKWDKVRSKPYWTQNIELSARAFEAYVQDRIDDRSGANDFLVYGTRHQELYPVGSERTGLCKQFGDSVSSIARTLLGSDTEIGKSLPAVEKALQREREASLPSPRVDTLGVPDRLLQQGSFFS